MRRNTMSMDTLATTKPTGVDEKACRIGVRALWVSNITVNIDQTLFSTSESLMSGRGEPLAFLGCRAAEHEPEKIGTAGVKGTTHHHQTH
ncbi:hypothetical protein Tco_0001946 [Tanacetum coccineum]